MKTSESLKEIFTALSKAQGEFKTAKKDANNPFFKSKYADFESVVEAVRPTLTKHGLSFVQVPMVDGDKLFLITRVCHSSGEWLEGAYPVNPTKNDPQGIGSSMTYSRRYALSAVLGIVSSDDDDDAEAATDRGASKADVVGLMKAFTSIGVSAGQVLAYIGVQSTDNLTDSDVKSLKQIGSDIKSGKAKKEDYFKSGAAK